MNSWFECKIRYEKVTETGMTKKVTEPYLVDALSFTEAESRIIEEITPYISGEFTVVGIKPVTYSEIFTSEDSTADRWFKCKVNYVTLDEKSGAEKKIAVNMLVQAADLREAVHKLDAGMKGTMADYEIAAVSETTIVDVYPYKAPEENPMKVSPMQTPANGAPVSGLNKVEREVRDFIAQCPEGMKTEVSIANRTVIIDKTGKETVVTPKEESPDNG